MILTHGVKLSNRKSMVPYEKLPNFLKGLDVCVHFFSMNHPITKYMHTNKFYMYLAAGKPVVTLNFLPELTETFGNLVKAANSYDEYIKYLEEAMSENSENEIKRRISFAEKNSCDARAKKKIMIIKEFINSQTDLKFKNS